VIWFSFDRSMVRPPLMFDAPVNAAWPPLFAANLHCVTCIVRTARETSEVQVGVKRQVGEVLACCVDQ
jgi:hypothetical protein